MTRLTQEELRVLRALTQDKYASFSGDVVGHLMDLGLCKGLTITKKGREVLEQHTPLREVLRQIDSICCEEEWDNLDLEGQMADQLERIHSIVHAAI